MKVGSVLFAAVFGVLLSYVEAVLGCPAATAFTLFDKAKKKIGNGTIVLGSGVMKAHLHTSASNASTSTLSLHSSVSSEVTQANGYLSAGKSLAALAWTVGASAAQYKFDATDPIWTASGGTIPNIKFFVLRTSLNASTGHLLCWSRLTTAQFTLGSGNTLTVQFNASGIFTLA